MTHEFVAQLPTVSSADLVYGNRCGICREAYGTNITGSDIVTEDAVRLPCGHEFGHDCLSTWLSPEQGKNSCPLCRAELFPAAAPATQEEESVRTRHGSEVDWTGMAAAVDAELSASGIVHRSRPFGDWLLYSQLQGQGARLPAWRPGSADPRPRLDATQEEALFRELQRRGAFRVLPAQVGGLVGEREVWGFLRERGWGYDPVYAATAGAGGCAWFQN